MHFGLDFEFDSTTTTTFQNDNSDCYFIIQKSVLEDLIKTLLCPKCKVPGSSLNLFQKSVLVFHQKPREFVVTVAALRINKVSLTELEDPVLHQFHLTSSFV